jgi:hypothetical protein
VAGGMPQEYLVKSNYNWLLV